MPQAFFGWRRFALRLFGAKVGRHVRIRPGVRVTFPWNLEIGDYCWIGDDVTLYSIAKITIELHSVISQESYLCTASHDHNDLAFPFVASPITVEPECWIAARTFVGPGTTIGRGAVIGACSLVISNVPSGVVAAGVPAKQIAVRGKATKGQ
jgi:putative colanic acid biosynthesis acetyltransferase WcaF